MLQPHRGSSGSKLNSAREMSLKASTPQRFVWKDGGTDELRAENVLQPHRGSSGRRVITPPACDCCLLQPHRGSSGSDIGIDFGRFETGASTPQRFVWKERPSHHRTGKRALQPHRGSSGSQSPRRHIEVSWQLQPHRGSSGSRARRAGVPRVYRRASTPQRFVWKRDTDGNVRAGGASTPQRFVWKPFMPSISAWTSALQPHRGSSGSQGCPPHHGTARSFNPTEVRLEARPSPSRTTL